jgi:tetratricopeptide (TPR) repeat protein
MDTELKVAGLIRKAYDKLKASDAEGAAALLEEALQIDFDNEETKHALKCVNWWLEHTARVGEIKNPYEKGGFILSRLKQYYVFLDGVIAPSGATAPHGTPPQGAHHENVNYDTCQYAIRRFVFSGALRCFNDLLGDGVNQHDPGLLLLVGRCYKGVGNYDEALRYLEQAVRFRRDDGEALAEMADVNAMLGNTLEAKTLFREAFFLNPEKIDLRAMESEMILRLRDRLLQEKNYKEEELREWMPVYGRLWGVFSVTRELKPIEIGRLRQSIFTLETECRGNPGQSALLKPRLLNRYFWLIDHYENTRDDPELIEEVRLKIKVADQEIYERYIR